MDKSKGTIQEFIGIITVEKDIKIAGRDLLNNMVWKLKRGLTCGWTCSLFGDQQ